MFNIRFWSRSSGLAFARFKLVGKLNSESMSCSSTTNRNGSSRDNEKAGMSSAVQVGGKFEADNLHFDLAWDK